MPDATELELIAHELGETVLETVYFRERATLAIDPAAIRSTLAHLRGRGYAFLASVHGVDYYPEEPRLGVLYEMMDMREVDRISVKARVWTEDPRIPSITDLFPGANWDEREVYDMFGIVFEGHPDMRRILMPEDFEGHPQRRDYPMGGEPVLFTYNEVTNYGKWQ
ncbi:MAG: NADH-quinone oxidoreductase subunit C [Solirubrobacteraceae bacterium]